MSQGYCDKDCKKITEGQSRGDQFQCGTCHKYSKQIRDNQDPETNGFKFRSSGVNAEAVIFSEKPIITEEDAIKSLQIDTKIWRIDKIEYGGSQGYRKDLTKNIIWKNGKIADDSFVEDSGKMLVVQLHSFRISMVRRTIEIRNELVVSDLIEKAQKYAPKYPKISYPKLSDGHLLEIGLPDLQLGRLVMEEETGKEITPDLQIEKAKMAINQLLTYSKSFPISEILFPVGHDYFDADYPSMFTVHGTPQKDDSRWQRTYKLGVEFIKDTVLQLSQIAPVKVKIIPGNHDENIIFHLGHYLEAWFHNSKDITIDNSQNKRKYFAFGKNMVMLVHGYYEKLGTLDSLMAYEQPQMWANSLHREVHLGDKHHKVDMIMKTIEGNGVVVRILRSLADPSVWEHDKGYVGSEKAAEAFIWHPENGVVAQFTALGK